MATHPTPMPVPGTITIARAEYLQLHTIAQLAGRLDQGKWWQDVAREHLPDMVRDLEEYRRG